MHTLEQCKEILKKYNETYTEEEILLIRDLLWRWVEWDIEVFKENRIENNEECNNLHSSQH